MKVYSKEAAEALVNDPDSEENHELATCEFCHVTYLRGDVCIATDLPDDHFYSDQPLCYECHWHCIKHRF